MLYIIILSPGPMATGKIIALMFMQLTIDVVAYGDNQGEYRSGM